jgi:GntR family transcriptional regulator, histidine utilization repressor
MLDAMDGLHGAATRRARSRTAERAEGADVLPPATRRAATGAADAGPAGDAAAPAVAPYARVKQHLLRQLAAGRWPAGALMPSEAELVAQFGVSRMTVNRALRELHAEGRVQRVQGVGTFAAALHPLASTLTVRDLHEEIAARGDVHSAEPQFVRAEPAPAALAERLGLAPGATVFHSLILHRCNGVPVQCEDRYVNPAAAPGYLAVDFSRTTPTHWLLQTAPLHRAQFHVEAGRATAAEAALLGIAADAACLIVVRRTETRPPGARQPLPVTLVRMVHPGDRYTLQGQFAP